VFGFLRVSQFTSTPIRSSVPCWTPSPPDISHWKFTSGWDRNFHKFEYLGRPIRTSLNCPSVVQAAEVILNKVGLLRRLANRCFSWITPAAEPHCRPTLLHFGIPLTRRWSPSRNWPCISHSKRESPVVSKELSGTIQAFPSPRNLIYGGIWFTPTEMNDSSPDSTEIFATLQILHYLLCWSIGLLSSCLGLIEFCHSFYSPNYWEPLCRIILNVVFLHIKALVWGPEKSHFRSLGGTQTY